jgi:hypothetical protein
MLFDICRHVIFVRVEQLIQLVTETDALPAGVTEIIKTAERIKDFSP